MLFPELSRLIDRWLPAELDTGSATALEMRLRARALVGMYVTSAVMVAGSFLVFLVLHLMHYRDFSVALVCIGIAAIAVFLQILMFYKLRNTAASAIMFSMIFFGATLGILIVTGGWNSPVKPLFFCAPMVSFLIGGRHEGAYISVLVLIAGLISLVAGRFGLQIFQIIRPENIDAAGGVIWVISINLLLSCLFVYDSILEAYCKAAAHKSSRRS